MEPPKSPRYVLAGLIVVVPLFLFECAPALPTGAVHVTPVPSAEPARDGPPLAPPAGPIASGTEGAPTDCPFGMVLVDGLYCPSLVQECIRWADPPTDKYPYTRCAEFKRPATCPGERVHQRYCIDREEYVRPPEALPLVHEDWNEAEADCEDRGARLCSEPEWELACEGDEMLPYPYGTKRDSSVCNFDRTDLGKMGDGLYDHRAPIDAFPACVSPFGVHDMVGNVDEWTLRPGMSAPHRSALHGGWWLPGRNNCRAATREHGEDYSGKQVGFRCCRDADPPTVASR